MKRFLLLYFLISPFLQYGQSNVDSLKYILHQKEGLAKAQVLSELVDMLKREQPKEALGYARMLKGLLVYGNESDRYNVNQQLARAYFNLGIFDSAKYYHLECLKLAQVLDQANLITGSYINLSEDERLRGNADVAMDYLLQAQKVAEQSFDQRLMGRVYNNIGISFKNMDKYDEALVYYRKGLRLNFELPDTLMYESRRATTLNNIGTVMVLKGAMDSAQHYYHQALQIRREINDQRGIASTLNNIGCLLSHQENYEGAKTVFLELIPKTKAINDIYGTALAYYNLGDSYTNLSQPDSALHYLNQALDLGRLTGANSLIQMARERLSEIYDKKGLHELAFLHYKEAIAIKDSIANIQRVNQLNELQAKFDSEQKAKDLEITSKKRELAELQRNFLIGGLALFFILASLIIFSLRLRVKKNRQLVQHSEALRQRQQEVAELKFENSLLERERLLKELDARTLQLTSSSLHLIQNRQLLEEVHEKLESVGSVADPTIRSELSKVANLVEYGQNLEEDWQRFQGYFDSLHRSFFENLKATHDELTTNDLRLCALIRLNFSVKEAATILNISHGSMKTARYRLRKKLSLEEGDDLYTILLNY